MALIESNYFSHKIKAFVLENNNSVILNFSLKKRKKRKILHKMQLFSHKMTLFW